MFNSINYLWFQLICYKQKMKETKGLAESVKSRNFFFNEAFFQHPVFESNALSARGPAVEPRLKFFNHTVKPFNFLNLLFKPVNEVLAFVHVHTFIHNERRHLSHCACRNCTITRTKLVFHCTF